MHERDGNTKIAQKANFLLEELLLLLKWKIV